MPRRRLSERQLRRIRQIQERRRGRREARAEFALAGLGDGTEPGPRDGRVIVRHGAGLVVEDGEGAQHRCTTRRHAGHPVCGDRVLWEATGDGGGVIVAIEPRITVLSRTAAGRDKPLAANISVIVVVAAVEPPPSGFLIDQYLVAAERIGVPALVVCNKIDLLPAGDPEGACLAPLEPYRRAGYPLLPLSLHRDPQAWPLRRRLAGETAILLGQSGVGKSSLVNALIAAETARVAAVSAATGFGRHTTSAATSYPLAGGGRLIDSPGVRTFRLGAMARAELEQGFAEFRPHLGGCRFNDCGHRDEPGCALRAAVAAGAIAAQRLAAFHQLSEGLDTGPQRAPSDD